MFTRFYYFGPARSKWKSVSHLAAGAVETTSVRTPAIAHAETRASVYMFACDIWVVAVIITGKTGGRCAPLGARQLAAALHIAR